MKKVLVVADLNEGAPRIPGLIKYLPKYGWQPILLTSHKTVRATRKAGRRFFGRFRAFRPIVQYAMQRYREVFYYPDSTRQYRKQMVQEGKKVVSNVDAIISSSSPATCHIVASKLKQHANVPWVADFRDLWTLNHNYPYTVIRKQVETQLEHDTLKHADRFITTSEPLSQKMRVHYGKPTFTVTNGFDPDTISSMPLTPKFTITYTGQIYQKQDVVKPLRALAKLIKQQIIEPENVEVRFYGKLNKRVADSVDSLGLEGVVQEFGPVSHEEALLRQRESQVLLLLKWEDPEQRGVYTTKVFEYLAAKRPMLASGGFQDVVSKLLDETQAGVDVHSARAVEHALARFYREWQQRGETGYSGRTSEIARYSFVEMARKFSQALTFN